MTAHHPQKVAAWLAEVFGGPERFSGEHGGYTRMISEHVGRRITATWRPRWVTLMLSSAREAGMPMPPWGWTTAAGPPGGRLSAVAPVEEADEADEAAVALPGEGEPICFQGHIRPLFRARDRQSMRFVFDLWSHDDVRTHADAIAARLADGTMPCDGAWPRERVELFRRWVDGGTPA